ncbi:hypothetical protein J2X31_002583 [Flavobacterium arsenatis]|uniref:Uncharacterized protein n=1 Tax=Flavobacterium arsenatis TaxID=1484332 RepID=A0ABU1TRR9_9FLAO|nr:hypothetical protein [Flavobacterium arsenatis]MDR6968560.1 hypothetical protein [Flavobacterium arsenatis]
MTKINHSIKWILILFFITILSGCEKEMVDEIPLNSNNYVRSLEKFTAFESNSGLVDKIDSINIELSNRGNTYSARYENESFDLDFDTAIHIENLDGSYHSYTFTIYNDQGNYNLNNIVLSSLPNGSYEAFIVTYILTEAERELLENGTEIDLSTKTIIEPFNMNQISTSQRSSGSCYELVAVEIEEACTIDGCWDPDYTNIRTIYLWAYTCGNDAGGTGTGTGTGSGTSGGGGGTIATLPLIQAGTPCGSLQAKSKDPDYKAKMTELKQKAATQNVESGYVTYQNAPKFSSEFQGTEEEDNGSYVDIPLAPNRNDQNGFIHCHLDATSKRNFAVFSLSDLFSFAALIQNSTASNCTLMVTSAKGTFAIVITNKTAFINTLNALYPFKNMMEDSFEKVYVDYKKSSTKQLEGFLRFFKETGNSNSGFEVFSCDENFSNWKKRGLNNNNQITETPC